MRLNTLKLTNFRQHANTTIEFGSGITGIIGPNGSGKTTLLEAIAWALYGNDAARGRRDSIRFVRADAKAPVRAELEFDLAGHRYRVVRGITSAELYLDGGEQPIANSITSVSELLHRRLGMTRNEFFNTYFTGQKELSVMTALGPTERGQFLSRVLGYDRLRVAQELARERRRELIAELNGLRQAMPDPDAVAQEFAAATARLAESTQRATAARTARERAEASLAKLTPAWEAAQRDRAVHAQLVADLRGADLELAARVREHDRAKSAVTEAEAAALELAELAPRIAPLDALETERDGLERLAREDGRRQALTAAVKGIEEELAPLEERRARLADSPKMEEEETLALEAKRRELHEVEQAAAVARTALTRDRQDADTKREELRKQYADLKEQRDRIVELGEGGTCPTCKRPLETHYRDVLDLLDGQIDDVKLRGNYFKGRVEQLKAEPAELTALDERRRAAQQEVGACERRVATVQRSALELQDVERTIARQGQRLAASRAELATLPTGYDAARHEAVRRELEQLAPLAHRATGLQAVVERASAARQDLVTAKAAADVAGQRAGELRAAVERARPDDVAFESLRVSFDRASVAARECAVALATAQGEVAGATEGLDRARAAQAELARSEALLGDLTRERRLHDELDHTFTDLRTDLNFALRPELSKLASGFLDELTDGRYSELDIDDQYNLVIVEDGAPKTVISGGEEDLANLAMRLAISQMIAERSGQVFTLLILDEVFGSLDETRRQGVVDVLRKLHDRFEQVVLITHLESIRDGCDQVLHVHYDPGTGAAVVQPSAADVNPADLLVEADAA